MRIEADHLAHLTEDNVFGLLFTRSVSSPRQRMAAFCISSGSVPMATVKTLGTLTRISRWTGRL